MTERTKKRAQFLIDVTYIAVIVLLVYLFLKYVTVWILPFILAFCLVTALNPVIKRVVNTLGVNRKLVSIIVIILIYALVGTLLFLLVMQAIFMIRDALTLLPQYFISTVSPAIVSIGDGFDSFIWDLPEQWRTQAESIQRDAINSLQTFLLDVSQKGIAVLSSMTGRVPSFILAMLFTIMLSFFISIQYDKLILFISTQLPERTRKIVYDVRIIFVNTILKYLKAALIMMCITFTELSIGLLLLGQKNAIPIAAGIAVLDALPVFGTGAVVIPWVFVELVRGNYALALGLAILYAIVVVMRNILEPRVVGAKLGLNPIVSIMSIYLGFRLIGVFGMILMPITTQIVLALHRKGSIRIFKESGTKDVASDDVVDNDGEK